MPLLTRWLGSFAVACLIWPDALAQTPASPATSGSGIVRDLLTSLWAYDRDGRPSKKRVLGFELPESLLNFYLVESLTSTPRPMVDSLQVQLLSENRCRITARLDFDALWKQYPTLFSAKEREIFH